MVKTAQDDEGLRLETFHPFSSSPMTSKRPPEGSATVASPDHHRLPEPPTRLARDDLMAETLSSARDILHCLALDNEGLNLCDTVKQTYIEVCKTLQSH